MQAQPCRNIILYVFNTLEPPTAICLHTHYEYEIYSENEYVALMINARQSIQGERHTHTAALCGLHTITFGAVPVNMLACFIWSAGLIKYLIHSYCSKGELHNIVQNTSSKCKFIQKAWSQPKRQKNLCKRDDRKNVS